jgi:hypothetical protein
MEAPAMADQLAGGLVPEPPAAAPPGSEWRPVCEAASPPPNVTSRVLDESAGYSLDGALLDEFLNGALLDELARSLLGRSMDERN